MVKLSLSSINFRYKKNLKTRARVLKYIMKRLIYTENIMDKLDIIPRTVEMTKLYGCDYESVVIKFLYFSNFCEKVYKRNTIQN